MVTRDLSAATRYAQALFEIARLTHQDELVEAELESFSKSLKDNQELQKFLLNPYFRVEQKRTFLQRLYQERRQDIYEQLLNFFTVLLEKNRFHMIHEIAVEFKRIADEAQGQGVAEIFSARPLDPKAEAAIVSRIEKIAGYKMTVKKEVSPQLLGGVTVRVKNKIIDGSLRYRLDIMKKELATWH